MTFGFLPILLHVLFPMRLLAFQYNFTLILPSLCSIPQFYLNKQNALQVTSKNIEMTEAFGYIDIYPMFLCNVGTSNFQPMSLEYLTDSSKKQEFWRTVPLFLQKFNNVFLVWPACPVCIAYFQQSRQGYFLPHMVRLITIEDNSTWKLFNVLLWNRFILLGTVMKIPVIKTLKSHILCVSEEFEDHLPI